MCECVYESWAQAARHPAALSSYAPNKSSPTHLEKLDRGKDPYGDQRYHVDDVHRADNLDEEITD